MAPNESGYPLLHIALEGLMGQEGYLEREVELGHGCVAENEYSTKSGSRFGPPGLLHVVGQAPGRRRIPAWCRWR